MSADPKPYPVVYDAVAGMQYAFNSGWITLGIPTETANQDTAGIAANFGPTTLFVVPTTGMYLLSYYIVNTHSGSGGDSVGQLVFNYTDVSGGNALYANMPSGTNATLLGNGVAPLYLVAGSTVTYTEGSGVFAGGLVMNIAVVVQKL